MDPSLGEVLGLIAAGTAISAAVGRYAAVLGGVANEHQLERHTAYAFFVGLVVFCFAALALT